MELDKPIQELQRNIIKEILEMIDDIYLNDKKRRKAHYVQRRNEPNTILTTCGEVKYERTYFKSIEHVVNSSYRISGEIFDLIVYQKEKKERKVEVFVAKIDSLNNITIRASGALCFDAFFHL